MTRPPSDETTKNPFTWLLRRLAGQAPAHEAASTPAPSGSKVPDRLGHYAIERKLGEGGMGIVYVARDERLHRPVALKTISSISADETARQRFWREARAAASVNHPNVCQIYEIGEDAGTLFIAMELLEGQPLSDRLKQGPMPVGEAVRTSLGILAALSAVHARGIVHRDLKPSNVFLTPHGVKVLDFGLARPALQDEQTALELTRAGAVLGSPRYMAPEQASGEAADARTDLFAVGAMLFEMLAGRPAFVGATVVAILHATMYEQPPALTGPSAVAAVDRIIRRALAKRREDRIQSADSMADQLRDIPTGTDETAASTHPLTRLVVLPFRTLRSDPDTDFLAFSLPDAITTSLSGIPSLVVRSSATAAKFAGDAPDFKALASEAGVDRVVTGTLVRSGDQLRVVAQLVETPSGTVITSETVPAPLGDLFKLQDDITRRIVNALSLPLGGATPSPSPDVPQNARGYELYLRANELARTYDRIIEARDLYERCVGLDPAFAPAWARLGRCHRVIGKYVKVAPDSDARAEEAYRRALELNPRLTIAHKLYALLEADAGRGVQALVRLISEATRHGNDPELFAGLVHVCRYCGLYEESITAHLEARRLDPNIETSAEQTVLMTGDIDRMLTFSAPGVTSGADDVMRAVGLGLAGRKDEARERLRGVTLRPGLPLFHLWMKHLGAWLDRRPADMFAGVDELSSLTIFQDPDAVFQEAWLLCDAGDHERGLSFLERAVGRGYFASPALTRSPQFDPLRDNPRFQSLLNDAEAGRQRALAAFKSAGGDQLLGR